MHSHIWGSCIELEKKSYSTPKQQGRIEAIRRGEEELSRERPAEETSTKAA